MNLKSLSIALATTALVTLALPAMAQDKTGQNVNPTATGTPGAASTMGMAQALYATGVSSGDALTVLTAAKLAMSVEVKEGPAAQTVLEAGDAEAIAAYATVFSSADSETARKPIFKPGKALKTAFISRVTLGTAPADDAEGAANTPVDATVMLAKAKELAADDEVLLALIADAEAEGSRGRIGGAVSWLSRLPAGMQDVWEVPFYGNSYAEIAVVGDGDANLDVAVTDENGNVICYDVSWSDKLYCDFTPSWDGYFYVTVENRGRSRNSYYLMTN